MNALSTPPPNERIAVLAPSDARLGVFTGIVPLALLVLGIVTTLLVSAVVLSVTGSVGFMTRQTVMLAVVGVGLLLSLVIYTVMCVRALRQVRHWQRLGASNAATGALWTLALTALVTLSPVLIALIWPAPRW